MVVSQWIQLAVILQPKGHLSMSKDILIIFMGVYVYVCMCVYVCGHIYVTCTYATWVKVRDTTKIREGTRKPPTRRNYPFQNVNSAEDEKSCLTTTDVLFSFSSRMNDGRGVNIWWGLS